MNMILKKTISSTVTALMAKPAGPILNQPRGMFLRPVVRFATMAMPYEVEDRMIKEPVKSVNAVLLPRVIAPRAMVSTLTNMVASIGHERRSLTCANVLANGVTLSRASAHQMRPTVKYVPQRHGISDKKMMNRRLNVALVLPVACWYRAVRGNAPG